MALYAYQERIKQWIHEGRSIILQAPTGAGKTRAALAPFIEAFFDLPATVFPKKCIYAVPMRVLANQFESEYREHAGSYERRFSRTLSVKVQTGERGEDPHFRHNITFATIDQVLSSWLMHPYSLSGRMGNMNAGAFVGSYLIFDEFHLFDPDSTLPTTLHMLQTLRGASPFVLMTATFSADMLQELAQLLDAEALLLTARDLQGIGSQNKERHVHLGEVPLVIEGVPQPDFVLECHQGQSGTPQRSVVIFNQVERAQRFAEGLQQRAPAGTQIRLLHSRFRQADRQSIEEEIGREFGKDRRQYRHESMILVATQVIEVGLDITCQALHTELAPASAILQRAGRCARYEGERGHVYVYPVGGNYAPYGDKLAKAQCELSWQWLGDNQERHLTFADEQALVNYAHAPADRLILDGLKAGAVSQGEEVRKLWDGIGSRSDAQRLIRNGFSQAVVVHGNPDQLLRAPYAAERFSLHPGTLRGKFKQWQEDADQKRDDFLSELQPPDWILCRLEEDEAEDEAQLNRPIRYRWVQVTHPAQLTGASLLAVHPYYVGYRPDLGLTLYASDHYECELPAPAEGHTRSGITYRREPYAEHIRLVHQAFAEQELPALAPAGLRIERANGWQPGLVADMAQLVIWLHDLGKMNTAWQDWATSWQMGIGEPVARGSVLAHTTYDGRKEAHRALDKKLRARRPPHAVESALAAVPYLKALTGDVRHPLFRAAFTAIARHHAPFSREARGYELVDGSLQELTATSALMPESLRQLVQMVQPIKARQMNPRRQQQLENDLLLDTRDRASVCCYMLLVRALRHADQEGTKRGSR